MTAPAPLSEGSLAGLAHHHLYSGKVRELFTVGDDLLMVASDRISVYDQVLPTEIPDKGIVLTALSLWWFDQLADLAPNHLVASRVQDFPAELAPYADALRGRSVICRRLAMVPVECVARGYLGHGGLPQYAATGAISGVALPPGLVEGSELPEPIFTPTTKGEPGQHDEPMTYDEVVATVGAELAGELRSLTLALYARARGIARDGGIILADTKVELGHDADGRLVLGDEVLTPDSSRFWPAAGWTPGGQQPSYDKQFVRDWLRNDSGWDGSSPLPSLPDEVVERTRAKYVEAYEAITGKSFTAYLRSL